jgi:hypothetical protein
MSTIVNKLIQTIQNVNIQPHSKGEISRQKGNLTKVYDRYDRKNARQQNSITTAQSTFSAFHRHHQAWDP